MKEDFPIFSTHPDMIYLDSAATVQKPQYVIDNVNTYLSSSYANIHRGWYQLAEESEELYWKARKKVAEWIGASSEEVVFTWSSTDSVNRLVWSLQASQWIWKDDVIVVSQWEHHANMIPWIQFGERVWCTVLPLPIRSNGAIDVVKLKAMINEHPVKLVAASYVSNVTWMVEDVVSLKTVLWDDVFLVVDASQAIAHIPVDVKQLGCDFLFFTGHKLWAYTWIGVLRWKKSHLEKMMPWVWWWAAIEDVTSEQWVFSYTLQPSPDKFEPWTPNLVGAMSLFYALEYIESKGWYTTLQELEDNVMGLTDEQFAPLIDAGHVLPLRDGSSKRIWVYSFILRHWKSPSQVAQWMAERNICIRCGGQCAHPLHHELWVGWWSCRISFWLYTTEQDIMKFFDSLHELIETKS